MSKRTASVLVCLLALGGAAAPVHAQFQTPAPSSRAIGENYHVEISGSLWDPTPQILINSESLEGIPGSDIDFIEDLGVEKKWFRQLKVVLQVGKAIEVSPERDKQAEIDPLMTAIQSALQGMIDELAAASPLLDQSQLDVAPVVERRSVVAGANQ